MQTNTFRHQVWLHDRNQPLKSPILNPICYMQTILIYYPKCPSILNKLTSSTLKPSDRKQRSEVQRLYKRISSKYSKSLIRAHYADAVHKRGRTEALTNKVTSLCIDLNPSAVSMKKGVVEHMIKQNKNLKTVQIYWNSSYSAEILKCLSYVSSLQTLEIYELPYLPFKEYKRILFAARKTLKYVSIFGINSQEYRQGEQKSIQLVNSILDLPHLKKLLIDTNIFTTFRITPALSVKLNKISFDLRISHDAFTQLQFITDTRLYGVDFLGINTDLRGETSLIHNKRWSIINQEHLKAQEQSQQKLFFNIHDLSQLQVANLFSNFLNIITLDLVLSRDPTMKLDFTSLRYLRSVENLFIQLYLNTPVNTNLFENLALCTQKYQTLKMVSLGIFGWIDLDCYAVVRPFFEACADCVAKVIFNFNCSITCEAKIRNFYDGLARLKRIKSLSILYEQAKYGTFGYHLRPLQWALAQVPELKEFHLSVKNDKRIQDTYVNFAHLKELEKLALCLFDTSVKTILLQQIKTVNSLKHLELSLTILHDTIWDEIQRGIWRLKRLETLKIICVVRCGYDILKKELEVLIISHPSLKFIAVKLCREGNSDEIPHTVWVFRKGKYWTDIDSFLWNDCVGVPQRYDPEIYSFQEQTKSKNGVCICV